MSSSEPLAPKASDIVEADDAQAIELERAALEVSDNGWSEGDPLDQPDNPEEARTDG